MGYTHFDKVSANSFAIGQKGSEVDINPDYEVINAVITDVSSGADSYAIMPYAGTIEKISTVNTTALATNGAAAITFYLDTTAGTQVTGADIEIAASSAAGAVDTATPTAYNTVTANQAIAILTDGGSTNTSRAEVQFILKRT